MRIWSIHPCYLDSRGLVALWREALLAQKVLRGETRGYRNHPQLLRFRETGNPSGAIASYMRHVHDESRRRGYNFDRDKIGGGKYRYRISVTRGQLEYEFCHLMKKLNSRDPERFRLFKGLDSIKPNPLFQRIPGGVEDWEKSYTV